MAFQGMRGNGDWATDQRPKNWRETILHEFPNGDAPITAMLSMLKSESTNDAEFNWWTKRLPVQGGAVSSIYIDAALSTEYVYATHLATHGAAGDTVYAKVAAAVAQEFRKGHTAVLKDTSRFDVDVVAKVTGTNINGASSVIALRLKEADDNSGTSASYNLATVDRILVNGNSNPEGGAIPRAIGYDPVKYYNYTQIFRTPLEITRTAKKTRLRTGDQVKEAKREALQLHSVEQEKALLWGIRDEDTTLSANGKPERTFMGWIPFIRDNATSTAVTGDSSYQDYRYTTNYSSQSWLDGGEDWLDDMLEYLGTYAPDEVVALCGAGALTGLTKLAKYTGNITFSPGPLDTYGLRFRTWMNTHITLQLKKHPLMAREPSLKNAMLIFAPKNMTSRILDDTMYLPDRQARGVDGEMSEYLTEWGPEFHFPDQAMYLDGVGKDSLV